jgi:hypothetical protein
MRSTTVDYWIRDSSPGVLSYDAVFVGVRRRNSPRGLCQNCVTYPSKPPVNTVTYGRIPTPFVVAGTD